MKYSAIILSAGKGVRTGLEMNKNLFIINGKTVLEYSINFFKKDPNCCDIILVVSKDDISEVSSKFIDEGVSIILGGETRQESTFNALGIALYDDVLIHDAARPFISRRSISNICTKLSEYSSITLGVKVKDTIQIVEGNRVVKTLDRNSLIQVQTPQAFNKSLLLKAHKLAIKDGFIGTDDTILMDKYLGINAFVVEGDYRNIKLTTKEDIKLLEVILNENRT